MIRSILKQLWNERKSNGWIFIEILVIAVIAWFSFDTIYVIKYQESIPLGFDKENIYILNTSTLKEGNLYYDASRADTAALLDDYDRLRRLINDHPLISSAYITQRWGIPLTGSSN